MHATSDPAIAVIGMAGRFPDAPDVQEFWHNLVHGHESLKTFSDAELLSSGIPPALIALPEFVRKASIMEGADLFDAGFFGFNPREAELIDPQHRVLLECAWEAMEDAGYGGGNQKNVGVYAGAGMNSYVVNLLSRPDITQSSGHYQLMIASDKDFLASRIGYKLDLRGPCITLQTACSTSLVAVHVACQALLARDCDMALAGGVSLHFPQKTGYLFQEGMIFSPDGHCRPFDADGRGIHSGEGAAIVVLKRLEDARRDGDSIRGVILGTAVNNDGADKIGYTAPSIDGQANVLSAALRVSGVDAASITYIEAHGTATPLGDTIEFAALSRVYGGSDVPCTIGAVKSNVGHLDVAAGVAGLIKSLLALQHQSIPPTLHFRRGEPAAAVGGQSLPYQHSDPKLAPGANASQSGSQLVRYRGDQRARCSRTGAAGGGSSDSVAPAIADRFGGHGNRIGCSRPPPRLPFETAVRCLPSRCLLHPAGGKKTLSPSSRARLLQPCTAKRCLAGALGQRICRAACRTRQTVP